MTYPIDTYRDSFLRFMAEGMNYAEALEQFDEKEFTAAAFAEMEDGGTRRISALESIEKAGQIVTNDSRELVSLFDLLIHAQCEKRNSVDGHDYQQALDLWQAGWKSENPHEPHPDAGFWGQVQVMSWYWRRPPRREGSKGMLFLSTKQAWNALQRETAKQTQ